MSPISAGLLMYRRSPGGLEVLLVHPGGPFFRRRDEGSWSIPKGLVQEGEVGLAAARREFEEETGWPTPTSGYLDLGEVLQKGGKRVRAWAFEGEHDPSTLRSNTFEIEWPPRSGRRQTFPEVDRGAFFDLATAEAKALPAQVELLSRLVAVLGGGERR